jgi:drug/metabolite transporter (DMT)-like permease
VARGDLRVGQVLLIRSLFALVVLLPCCCAPPARQRASVDRPMVQAARVVFSTAEVFCFYAAVTLPLADVMTYWLAAPIYVAALSPFLLGERSARCAGPRSRRASSAC